MRKDGLIMLICLFLTFIFTAEAYAGAEAGKVLTVKRKVYLLRGEQRENARPQMPLLLKDAVETAERSRTKLFFTDDSILNLGELSKVVVEEYLYSPEKKRSRSIYRLIDGSLKVVVGRSDLEIHTPTAVAAARGTKFIIWSEGIDKSVRTCVMVLEGEVLFRNIKKDIKGAVTVKEGNKSCVPTGRPPQRVSLIEPELLRRFTEQTVGIGNILENRSVLPARMPTLSPAVLTGEMGEIYQPPVSQEPTGGFKPGNTPVDVIIIFPK